MFYVDGGAGDDIIKPYTRGSEIGVDVLVRAGKGNDKINVYEGSDLYDSDGAVVANVYSNNIGKHYDGSLLLDGGEGDDEIWHFHEWSNTDDELAKIYGGNGDDILKNGADNDHGLLIAG